MSTKICQCDLCGREVAVSGFRAHRAQCLSESSDQQSFGYRSAQPPPQSQYAAGRYQAPTQQTVQPAHPQRRIVGKPQQSQPQSYGYGEYDEEPPARTVLASKPRETVPPPAAIIPAYADDVAGLVSCSQCGRNFAADRISKHESVCNASSKRKVFNSAAMRTADLEPPAPQKSGRRAPARAAPVTASAVSGAPIKKVPKWRAEHEQLMQAVQASKQIKAQLDAGLSLADLPPPPPSENPDYVQCPHCSRRFRDDVAQRHIPKCKDIIAKPRPPPGGRGRVSGVTTVPVRTAVAVAAPSAVRPQAATASRGPVSTTNHRTAAPQRNSAAIAPSAVQRPAPAAAARVTQGSRAPAPPVGAQARRPSTGTRFCTNCGDPYMNDSQRFCGECGSRRA